MKKLNLCLIALLALSLNLLQAQGNTTEPKSLLGDAKLNTSDLGFFLSPGYNLSQMDGAWASLLHLRGGLSYKDRLSFGGFYNFSLNQIQPQSEAFPGVYMDYWAAGGFVEYTLWSHKLVHLSFPLYIGYGEVEMDNEMGAAGLGEANFLNIEPSALLEINLHQYARLNIGAGYRFIGPMTYRGLDQTNLSGLTAQIGLKFGLFRFK